MKVSHLHSNHRASRRTHALRHYSATELLTAGVDLRTVAGRLGHGSGGATTLRFYAAWVDEADHRAADAISAVLPRPEPTARASRHPYELLAASIRRQIESGELSPGAPLPSTTDLSVEHSVSAGTVNRAIALLKSDGLVSARRGQRATVARLKRPEAGSADPLAATGAEPGTTKPDRPH